MLNSHQKKGDLCGQLLLSVSESFLRGNPDSLSLAIVRAARLVLGPDRRQLTAIAKLHCT